jgi:hypothetical protein
MRSTSVIDTEEGGFSAGTFPDAGPGMHHFVARALAGTLLFREHVEARALWIRIVHAAPGLVALVLMPNHFHLQHPRDVRDALRGAMGGFAQWRNERRGERGRVWSRMPDPAPLVDSQKRRRTERYIHLNPCRAGIVQDPLAWVWSTHRDAVGLALDPVRPRVRDPGGYHRWVSSDPHTRVDGTELPITSAVALAGRQGLTSLAAAVSEVTRTPAEHLHRRGPARSLLLRCARSFCQASTAEIAEYCGVGLRAVQKVDASEEDALRLVARVAGDSRFPGVRSGDLRRLAGWRRFRDLR